MLHCHKWKYQVDWQQQHLLLCICAHNITNSTEYNRLNTSHNRALAAAHDKTTSWLLRPFFVTTLFFLSKSIVFLAKAEYSLFNLMILLWKYSCEYSYILSWSNFWARVNALKPDLTHITSCRNAISIEHTASAIFVTWLVLQFWEWNNFFQPPKLFFARSQPRVYSSNILKIPQISALIFLLSILL